MMATIKTLCLSLLTILRCFTLTTPQETNSFARPGHLNATTSFSSSPAIQLLRNDTLTYALLSAPNAAAQFGLLLHTYNGKQACSAALLNATSYIMWMRPCPPLAYTNCTLTFSAAGELVLATDGVVRWTSRTSSKGAIGMTVMNKGEVLILNKENQSVWNSASDPTASACLEEFEPRTASPNAATACAPPRVTSSENSYASSNLILAYWVLMSGAVLHCLL